MNIYLDKIKIKESYIFWGNANRCSVSDDSGFDDDTRDDRVSGLEDEVWHDPQLAGEDDDVLELLALLTFQVLLVGREAVEQVVNDVGLQKNVSHNLV